MSTNQIAIDGPAGAGKSTIARMVADRLGFIYIDTGAMYRTVALYLLRQGIDPSDEKAAGAAAALADIRLENENGNQKILLNGEDVTGQIRTQEVGAAASLASRYAAVRSKLTALQRQIAAENSVVMDGRDIGTTVLPNAQLKIYLTADAAVRAKRRFDQLAKKGESGLSLSGIEQEIRARDRQDMERKNSPLKKAEDAVLIDSSDLTIDEVRDQILDEYRKIRR
jgi:cytidylate kinase